MNNLKVPLALFACLASINVLSQSAAMYITNNCTYKTKDGQTITLNENGSVLKNGIVVKGMKCENVGGAVALYLNGKQVNELTFNGINNCDLKDRNNRCYALISCNPNAQSTTTTKPASKFLMPEQVGMKKMPYTFYTAKSIGEVKTIFKNYFSTNGFFEDENKFSGYSRKESCQLVIVSKTSEGTKVEYSWECGGL